MLCCQRLSGGMNRSFERRLVFVQKWCHCICWCCLLLALLCSRGDAPLQRIVKYQIEREVLAEFSAACYPTQSVPVDLSSVYVSLLWEDFYTQLKLTCSLQDDEFNKSAYCRNEGKGGYCPLRWPARLEIPRQATICPCCVSLIG